MKNISSLKKQTGYWATNRIKAKLVRLPVGYRSATRLGSQNFKIGGKKNTSLNFR